MCWIFLNRGTKMKNSFFRVVAVLSLIALVSRAETVVYEVNFDADIGTWASKVAAQMPGLKQAQALNGTEGVLTCNQITFMDAQLYATGSATARTMGLSLPEGKSWGAVVIRLRQLNGGRNAAGTAPQKFQGPGTSLVVLTDGKAKEKGPMIPGKAQLKEEADGWVVVTYDISDIASTAQITNLRVDPIGNPKNVGKSFEIDYIKVTAKP